jgi:hypothetical protein
MPFHDMAHGQVVTLNIITRDKPGALRPSLLFLPTSAIII